jgi:hypothetical protein
MHALSAFPSTLKKNKIKHSIKKRNIRVHKWITTYINGKKGGGFQINQTILNLNNS